jgi:hypothetical protein
MERQEAEHGERFLFWHVAASHPPVLARGATIGPLDRGGLASVLLVAPHADVVAAACLLEVGDVHAADHCLDRGGERAGVDAERRGLLAVGGHAEPTTGDDAARGVPSPGAG